MRDVHKTTCFIVAISTFVTCAVSTKDRLVLVQAVFRHGDRSPIGTFPNDKHRSYWKQGWGQLTQEGMRQEYNLGKLFKKRYGGGTLLGSKYNQSEIVITSSDFDRTLMSAYCVLSGLYPPNGTDQQWNPGLDWQPIPVHTRPQNEDFIISMRSACPRYDKLLSEYSGNSTLTKFMAQHQGLIDKIVNISGLTRDTWGRITDILFCQYVHNLSLPEWKSVLPFDLVQTIRDVSAANFLPTSEMKKMKAGSLLKEMIENMKTTLNTTAHPKVYLYSGHDSTVIALLRVLNVFDKRKPRYSACVMVEFWKTDIDGTPFIRIIHRNETDSNRTITLQIPGCSENCPFRDFVRILANHIPGDIKEECKIENEAQTFDSTAGAKRVGILLLVSILALLVLVLVILSILLYRGKRVSSAYKAVSIIDDDL